jgi:2-desacetyl-2-hydroxyethyl bacteriochlorophyllide A dehydrogenase
MLFSEPGKIDFQEQELPPPSKDQVLVQSLASAISPGTEMLVYRGQVPEDLPADDQLTHLQGDLSYPLSFGYSIVGRVIDIGTHVPNSWRGRAVFAFHPHADRFLSTPSELHPIPEDLPLEEALFFPNMETAVNLLHDGQPLLGEQVLVLGQGIVGLLTTSLLARLPLGSLIAMENYPLRKRAALSAGAQACLDSSQPELIREVRTLIQSDSPYAGADLVYELTGEPAALETAIAACGYSGRVVIGSWYGTKTAQLMLGTHFHRQRIQLISSQVSTIRPALRGRWSKARRSQLVWDLLETHRPARFITHRLPFEQADEAYATLDQRPQEAIQVILTYRELH